MAKLLVQESAGVREFEMVDNEVHIGRELDNTLRLADPSISRHHAVIRRTSDGWEVQDLQSSNGVLVNGNRVPSATLKDGDRVTLGQIQMTFSEPAASLGTVMMPAGSPPNPLGTVRMDPSEMAKIQGVGSAPAPVPTAPVPAIPVPPPAPVAPPPPPAVPAPPPVAAAMPPLPPAPVPPAPIPPPPMPPPMASPSYGTVAPEGVGENPAPGFLRPYLPSVPDTARPVMGPDGQPERGDFVTRLLAHLIDGGMVMAIFIVLWIVQMVLMALLGRALGAGAMAIGCLFGLLQLAISLGTLCFWPWCWMKFGATPGKKIMKLRVVPEANPQGRVDLGQAVLRVVGHMVNGVLFCLPYLLILGADRKGLQDMFSNSIVIKVDR